MACAAEYSRNESVPVPLYVVYGSISAPMRNSPRSVCETYTCSCEETRTTSRNGLTGSVTKAWRMCVVIGRRRPTSLPTSDDQPAVALTTWPHSTRPRVVSTAVMRSPLRWKPVTSVSMVDLDAETVGRAREAPHDGVVANDPARRVEERADDRVRGPLREVELGAELGDSRRVDDARLDPEELVDLGALLHRDHRAVRVRERQVPVLREHEVEVELLREPLVQPDALAVERRALGRAVVRADDRRVPARRARADVRLLEDRDVRDPVPLREVVRGREPVRAAADDHDLVAALELRPRPPHPLREEDLASSCQSSRSSPARASRTASAT